VLYDEAMSTKTQPFYDPTKTYDDNYADGPSGLLASEEPYVNQGEPKFEFLGHKLYSPFGIPAGPLLNSKYIKAAFEQGYDVSVYKTIRSDIYPCHPFPNVLAVDVEGDLTLERLEKELVASTDYRDPLSITNSFGVPSKKAEVWQEDVKLAQSYQGKGQLLVLSFMGTVRPDQTQEEFIQDYALAARLANETGVSVLETNLSCPNIGNEGLVCYNLDVTERVLKAIRKEIGNTSLVIKIGYFKDNEQLTKLAEIANEWANDISGINTLQAAVVDENGEQALPGPNRLRSGVCGAGIKWAGIETVQRLAAIRDKHNFKFSITGVGGVMNADDFEDYREAGADIVQSATGAMWNPDLAREVKQRLT
jgi:dihydroorotate dehydrogenase (NAD+) catalytic subunit